MTALSRGKVPAPFPWFLIVSQRSEAVKGKASPRNTGAPLTAPARRKETAPGYQERGPRSEAFADYSGFISSPGIIAKCLTLCVATA